MYNVIGMRDTKDGFSLIELVVAIGILAVLSAGMVSLIGPGSRQYARDVQRKTDLEQIRSALELYRNSNTGYVNASGVAVSVLGGLVPAYASVIPDDPQTTKDYYYTGTTTTYTLCAALEKVTTGVAGCGGAGACGAGMTCSYKVTQP